ncbi:MAG: hypothetical protein DCF23_03665 [Cyanobium sp.]|nr:MAG: hypothetical protein DCF23_03665 [Cyanobium sp.]
MSFGLNAGAINSRARLESPQDGTRPPPDQAMIRILGDRASLLAALTAHWADQQHGLSSPPARRRAINPGQAMAAPPRLSSPPQPF